MRREYDRSLDVVIIGAGLAGSAAAAVLGRQGWRVLLVDPRASCPPVFKAEKIEPDQAECIARLGLFDTLLSGASRIAEIRSYSNGRFLNRTSTAQHGIRYEAMVNTLRQNLPSTVEFKLGRICDIANSDDLQLVTADDGERIQCRLVVLACGLNGDLLQGLGLQRVSVQKHQSIAIGFDIARPGGSPFDFDSLTYSVASANTGIDYISFFPLGQDHAIRRANLFAFCQANAPWVRRFMRDPNGVLPIVLPKLHRALGEYRIQGEIEAGSIHLYRAEGEQPPGVVLIGDAAQNVCPSTGMGIKKIFTDVEILTSECVTAWFSTPGMDREKLRSFSDHPRKRETDSKALQDAFYRRNACMAQSTRWRIHRARLRLSMEFGRMQRRFGYAGTS